MESSNTRSVMTMFVIVLLCSLGSITYAQEKGEQTLVYPAKKVITMDASTPEATAVAVAGGKIVAVGSLEEVRRNLGDRNHKVDERFKDKVLVPGFIDNHLHPLIVGGFLLQTKFITPFDWDLPSGKVKSVRGRIPYIATLKKLESKMKDPNEVLFTWGHHRLFHGDISRKDLDRISSTRPIVVWNRSFHEVTLNTAAIEKLGIPDPKHPQVDWHKGLFQEVGFKKYFMANAAELLLQEKRVMPALKEAGKAIHRGGITTAADMMAGGMNLKTEIALNKAAFENEDTPFRMLLVPTAMDTVMKQYGGAEETEKLYAKLAQTSTHHLQWVKQVKLFADGAFFSQLMQMKDGYTDGHKGEWIQPPEVFERTARVFWNKGWQIHVHVNGDLGMKVCLDVLEKLLKESPRKDHRFTLHHAGYFTKAQASRIANLGAVVSAQPWYLYTMGDAYTKHGLGPERAPYMVRLKSLLDNGVKVSLHSDFTMAPAEPLKLGWVAVNRLSASGKVLGPEERITVEQALRAVTIDAAYAIQMEDKIGSIAPGKIADFTVLEQDPYEVGAEKLKDIPIWGTVFEGKPFPVKK